MEKAILDTDIGTDIDDAFALVLMAKSRAFDLLGVTTVYRNALLRAKLAKALLKSAGFPSVPVFAGVDDPFIQSPEKIEPPQCKQHYGADGKYVPPQCLPEFDAEPVESMHAVDFIIEACRREEHVHIFTIGALTNVAMALRKAPDIASKITLTIMGGCRKKIQLDEAIGPDFLPEWNILCDPEALKIVFDTVRVPKMVGLDVTLDCVMPQPLLEKVRRSDLGKTFNRLIDQWAAYYSASCPVLNDPLAIASALCGCVSFERLNMDVVLEGKHRGSVVDSANGVPVDVALGVDTGAFFALFEKIVLQ